jgi:hypothetical protein
MEQSEVASWCAIALSIATAIFGVVNHKRIRSHCCGRDVVASVDIETTTPPGPKDAAADGLAWQLKEKSETK